MRPPAVSKPLTPETVERMQNEARQNKDRAALLLRLMNFGIALNDEGINLTQNALTVLAAIAAVPGIRLTRLSLHTRITPGGTSKILDQLSIGRMARGVRQPGLGLIQRESGEGCFLTPEGERIVAIILDALEQPQD